MNKTPDSEPGAWFIYDGECPLCKSAAMALRIKQEYGELKLIDARQDHTHPLVSVINQRQYNLDEGMVIYDGKNFYHGADALWFMARFGDKGLFNRFNRLMFSSPAIARVCYPALRSIRNLLIKLRGVGKINNLKK